MENSKAVFDCSGLCGFLTIAFLILKLCNIINWSWLWVLAPLWIPFAFVMIAVVITLLIILITSIIAMLSN